MPGVGCTQGEMLAVTKPFPARLCIRNDRNITIIIVDVVINGIRKKEKLVLSPIRNTHFHTRLACISTACIFHLRGRGPRWMDGWLVVC